MIPMLRRFAFLPPLPFTSLLASAQHFSAFQKQLCVCFHGVFFRLLYSRISSAYWPFSDGWISAKSISHSICRKAASSCSSDNSRGVITHRFHSVGGNHHQ